MNKSSHFGLRATGSGRPGPRAKLRHAAVRREPRQQRARQTVAAVLQAVARILQREGVDAVTTNHIAEIAGVSIGSLYQYFPDKEAIYAALYRQHIAQVDATVQQTLARHAGSAVELLGALLDALIALHQRDPQLYTVLFTQLPHRIGGARSFAERTRAPLRQALEPHLRRNVGAAQADAIAFVLAQLLDALSHGVVLHRPAALSLAAARAQALRALSAYVRSYGSR